jgi:hypothetical protein
MPAITASVSIAATIAVIVIAITSVANIAGVAIVTIANASVANVSIASIATIASTSARALPTCRLRVDDAYAAVRAERSWRPMCSR